MARVTKPAKAPSWTKDLTLETYVKQVETWNDVNEDVPSNTKYQDFVEGLKTNKEIRGLPRFVAEHILPVLEKKQDQTVKKVLELLDVKYGRTQIKKIEECVRDWLEFKEERFEEEDELLLGMRELNQRRLELKIMENEWFSTWMLGRVKKRKRMEGFEYQELRNIIKEGGDDVIKNFEKKYRELKIEGSRKRIAETLCVEEKETLYMGSESEAHRRYQNNGYWRGSSYQ